MSSVARRTANPGFLIDGCKRKGVDLESFNDLSRTDFSLFPFVTFFFVTLRLFTRFPAFVFLYCLLCIHRFGCFPRVTSGYAAGVRLLETDMYGEFGKLEKVEVTE